MTPSDAGFSGPQYYAEFIAPVTFGPFAAELVRRVAQVPRGAVLELACGTGAVTRPLRQHLDAPVQLVATDLSAAMLDYARAQAADLANVTFERADMLALPFAGGSFAAAVCGFGVMFPPDRQAALAEARRVLARGAPFHFSVWDAIEHNPHALAVAEVIEGLFPGDAELRFRTPYEMADASRLRAMLAAAGFTDVQVETVRLPIADADPQRMATGMILGTPRSAVIAQRGLDPHAVVAQAAEALARQGGDPYTGYGQALLVTAR
ncbi:methyltransferase domain-containing protein [Ramlibacter sp. USB13]|uniref:Methyltransferase domain-containing protein n=1 Tax=Ramlibacter cellulosilyticus TaxID=2764187 RepID=A0A923MRF0_9BURK|nr:class I SAM-dependent methyltransferase [Ramlibacter cellulosilyticus]MBC5784100.1 methyltransferase domain-containing protein [Ramlibacter cellulosilyticus]